ncbi:MAG: hypothetical protein DME31_04530 [Verrucomicrobia bacterium]|nr:MAG: hypothetical protein DME31_04530 [Verrucomicrobiota bacterium]
MPYIRLATAYCLVNKGMALFNPLDHPICLSYPLRVASTASARFWVEHIPLGMFLVDVLRPRVLVELGTFSGVSFCAFCQAVKELGTGTRCYAVDTWQGDPHNGYYGPEVLRELKSHHDPLYGGFSCLIQSTFDEALSHFENGSIDLLHIDGFHAYEAVRRDFENWLPKMSDRGVMLFHDINVRELDFGVWKLWEEVKPRYPHFETTWGQGLGLLAVGNQQPDLLRSLCNSPEGKLTEVRDFFCQLGLRLALARERDELTAKLQEQSNVIGSFQHSLPMRFFYIWSRKGVGGVAHHAIAKLSAISRQLTIGRHHRRAKSDNRQMNVRPIALYLPQYHPIPENDSWWGEGFTEWTNVSKARPRFSRHFQPHVPADLGFYDLRLPEARQAQADLAREYGIYGFCYYSYWFNGKRLLSRPFDETLASGQPDFPFCLCWANENWTRIWDGLDKDILMEQSYSEEDDRQHIRWLANAFRDKRYIKVGERPLFLVYRARSIPDPVKTTSIWRDEARKLGFRELYLCRVESFAEEHECPACLGFDASVEFQPDWSSFPTLTMPLRRGRMWQYLTRWGLSSKAYQQNDVYSYKRLAELMRRRDLPPYKRFPCVTPGWDNSSRRKRGAIILKGSTPKLYRRWLEATLARFEPYGPGENLMFINAWNEWGEGSHLEPDKRWGRAYLEATRSALRNVMGHKPWRT